MEPLYTYDTLVGGTVLERENRFVLRVEVDATPERAYLRNSGGLETTLERGRRVLCRPAGSPDRATDYDAVAVRVGDTWVTVDATLPNDIVETCLDRGLLPRFAEYAVEAREPALPGEGRTDLRLSTPADDPVYVEVKSNTHVVDGVSKFPDRPTERGRRHLRSLIDLAEQGTECHVAFVVQRPDADRVRPFREVDPGFADLLGRARDAGVGVHALSTAFYPPEVHLQESAIPVDVDVGVDGEEC